MDEFILMAEKLVENGGNDTDEEHDSSTLNLFADKKAKNEYPTKCPDRLTRGI